MNMFSALSEFLSVASATAKRKTANNILRIATHARGAGGERKSKQYIPHEYILLTDRNDTSDRWVSTDAKASRRFWYRKYFEYLENIGYPKARCIQRLELQVASGFRDAFRYSVCITIEIPRKVHVHRKCIRVLSFRFALLYRWKLIRELR